MRKYKTSKRGLTFSITPDEQYYPGSHYVYEVRRNCIIIRPSEEGMTVSRKKCGVKEKHCLTSGRKMSAEPYPQVITWRWK